MPGSLRLSEGGLWCLSYTTACVLYRAKGLGGGSSDCPEERPKVRGALMDAAVRVAPHFEHSTIVRRVDGSCPENKKLRTVVCLPTTLNPKTDLLIYFTSPWSIGTIESRVAHCGVRTLRLWGLRFAGRKLKTAG